MRRIGAPGRLFCLDIQKEMVEEVRRRLSASAESGASFIQGSATHLPLAGDSVDHVLLITVLGEIPDRPGALAEIRRVLRSGGRLSVSEQLPDPDFLTPRALRRLLSAAGFIEETTRGFVVYTSTWRVAS
jgi:ubiquinone/menaquinone biosynthesis C-methylase UbiE